MLTPFPPMRLFPSEMPHSIYYAHRWILALILPGFLFLLIKPGCLDLLHLFNAGHLRESLFLAVAEIVAIVAGSAGIYLIAGYLSDPLLVAEYDHQTYIRGLGFLPNERVYALRPRIWVPAWESLTCTPEISVEVSAKSESGLANKSGGSVLHINSPGGIIHTQDKHKIRKVMSTRYRFHCKS